MTANEAAAAAAPVDDHELVRRAQHGETEACEELARRHRRSVFVLALQLTGSQDDALDISQDALLRFFSKLNRFDSTRPVRPWLFTIVRNRARDIWRRRKTRRAKPLISDGEEGFSYDIVDPTADPHQDLESTELRHRLWRALGVLSESKREILVLRDYHDLSYVEMADVLGIPTGTVMSRLHGARKALRDAYLEQQGGQGG
ncbi:MAG: sigma-70 family RNA polymerase sigma factor [Acidobacteriota bacterium]|nr:sigma-70 family RNA polymerase sigma factor [Acidobacteriota bacterium]